MINIQDEINRFIAYQPKNEGQFQAAAYRMTWNCYPSLQNLIFHPKNELDKVPGETIANHRARLAIAYAEGVLPGVPDFVLPAHHCAIELKVPGGSLSPSQRKIHPIWYAAGVKVYVAWSPEQYADLICLIANGQPADKYLSPAILTK